MNRLVITATAFLILTAAQAQDAPARIEGGVMAGRILTHQVPVYPPEAKAAHVSGTVVLHAVISRTGTVENLTVISGGEIFQNAALEAVRQWTYEPYLLNGVPTAVDTTITVNFNGGPRPIQMMSEAPAPTNPGSTTGMAGGVLGGMSTPPARVAGAAPPIPVGPARINGAVMSGQIISRTSPVYPPVAKAMKVSGAVVLHAIISKEGKIEILEVISGPEPLRSSAIDCVQQWTYRPYTLNGEPTEVETTITLNYNLGS